MIEIPAIVYFREEEQDWIAFCTLNLPVRQKRHPNHFTIPANVSPVCPAHATGASSDEAVANLTAVVNQLLLTLPKFAMTSIQVRSEGK